MGGEGLYGRPLLGIASMAHEPIDVRGSAGDHKGPPIHSTPSSPLQNPDRASWMPSLVLILPLVAIIGTQIKNLRWHYLGNKEVSRE